MTRNYRPASTGPLIRLADASHALLPVSPPRRAGSAVPMSGYTKVRFSDLPNHLEDEGGEFRMGRDALESPQVGVTWIRLAPDGSTQGQKGHYHDEQDEIYVLISGGPVEFKLDSEIEQLEAGEAIRIDAHTVRALHNAGSEALLIAASGAPPQGEDDSHPVTGFWELPELA